MAQADDLSRSLVSCIGAFTQPPPVTDVSPEWQSAWICIA